MACTKQSTESANTLKSLMDASHMLLGHNATTNEIPNAWNSSEYSLFSMELSLKQLVRDN